MEAKEILYQLRVANVKINNKLKELENMRAMLLSLGGASGERVQSSKKSHDQFANKIAKVYDFQIEINNDIDSYVDLKESITRMIDKITNSEHIDILYKRYVNNLSWQTISKEMKYSESYLYRLHGKALKEFEKVNEISKWIVKDSSIYDNVVL